MTSSQRVFGCTQVILGLMWGMLCYAEEAEPEKPAEPTAPSQAPERVIPEDLGANLIAGALVIFFAYIPFFAPRELRRVLGEKSLRQLFFRGRSAVTPGSDRA
jgi:hypothetical protein